MKTQNGASESVIYLTAPYDATQLELLRRYGAVIDGLADMYGQHCELALYSLAEPQRPLLKRLNGEQGAPLVGASLPEALALQAFELLAGSARHITYFTHSRLGSPIKSSVQLLMDDQNQAVGLLCIHLHLGAPFHELLGELLPKPQTPSPEPNPVEVSPENFNNNVEQLVTLTVERTIEGINANGLVANHLKNKHIVTTLYEKGIFDIKDAIAMVSNKLNISKHTVYLYIRQKKRDDEELSPQNPEIS
ncbi:helix-turn-helix transcriptional regulator [Oceanisphaera sp. W20_SRM_FM3]|uniref:helix-turn-helix transcriptional regulator n=1 Tax=Oceanisphaera sp. W20_SRM_FM3 TaxID=3240267 RepID=UPI003F9644F5